jgi:hypothetical protein
MKLILIPLLILLASCSQYRYDIAYEKCNGQTGSVSVKPINFMYSNRDRTIQTDNWEMRNICDFTYTRNEIK